jgi:hypothetical protein
MLSKTRTTIITLVAAFSFGGAAIVPTVAQARAKKPAAPVTCPDFGLGTGKPGDIVETPYNAIDQNGNFYIVHEKKICGSDGKWHTVVDLVAPTATEPPQAAPEPTAPSTSTTPVASPPLAMR